MKLLLDKCEIAVAADAARRAAEHLKQRYGPDYADGGGEDREDLLDAVLRGDHEENARLCPAVMAAVLKYREGKGGERDGE